MPPVRGIHGEMQKKTELSVAELLKETRDDVRDLVQAFIQGALPLREFVSYFLKLVTAETNRGEQRKMLIAISQFESGLIGDCLLYTSPSPRDRTRSRMPSSA